MSRRGRILKRTTRADPAGNCDKWSAFVTDSIARAFLGRRVVLGGGYGGWNAICALHSALPTRRKQEQDGNHNREIPLRVPA